MKKELTTQDWGMMIGREVQCGEEMGSNSVFSLAGIYEKLNGDLILTSQKDGHYGAFICKPILRTLDQMTEEEMNQSLKFFNIEKFDTSIFKNENDSFVFELEWGADRDVDVSDCLTQKGFDIRNWIDSGLAIKKEETK